MEEEIRASGSRSKSSASLCEAPSSLWLLLLLLPLLLLLFVVDELTDAFEVPALLCNEFEDEEFEPWEAVAAAAGFGYSCCSLSSYTSHDQMFDA